MSVTACTNYCSNRGFPMAGVEFGDECFCGSTLTNGASLLLTSGECKMTCSGNLRQNCGGPNAMFLYVSPNPLKAAITIPDGWSYKGCVVDSARRQLSVDITPQLVAANITPELCTSTCFQLGYSMAGLENSAECYCGNGLKQGAAASFTDMALDKTSQCNYACPGNTAAFCGGAWRLSVYSAN